MTQVVQPDSEAMLAGELDESVGERPGLQRLTVSPSGDVVIVGEAHTEGQERLGLSDAMAAQLLDFGGRQDNGAALAVLRLLFPDPLVSLLSAGDHRNLPALQIDVTPTQGHY